MLLKKNNKNKKIANNKMKPEIKKVVKKWALDNARKYKGKANQGAVISKIINEIPEIKTKLKEIMPEIAGIIKEVNSLGIEKQIKELEKIAPELLEEKKKTEEKKLKPLPKAVKGKVVTRMAPSPSGPLHIGHAFVLSLNSEYAKKYDGKLILRIEDTNPENIYPPAYEMIEQDAKWLTQNKIAKIEIQSSRLEKYYAYAETLIKKGQAYVCKCDPDKFRKLIQAKKACKCRNLDPKEHEKRWKKMFKEYKPGEAILRIKTDLENPNPALRDWPAMRINTHKHPKTGTKYKVWPLMNFSVVCDDHDLGITHSIRGKDHMTNEERQKQVRRLFGWKDPVALFFGRINFKGIKLSSTETRKKIEYGEYEGWDDIRLHTIRALKRRGYQPEAFIKFAIDMGLSLTDKTVDKKEFYKILNSHNKEIIEPKANRYFFVWDPVEVAINKAPSKKVELALHPDFPKRGKRILNFDRVVLITKDDFKRIEQGKLYRLMDCWNFTRKNGKLTYHSGDIETYRKKGAGIFHWLPIEEKTVNVEVLMPDNKLIKGVGESGISKLKIGDIVQLERFGFCRLDSIKKGVYKFWYAHR